MPCMRSAAKGEQDVSILFTAKSTYIKLCVDVILRTENALCFINAACHDNDKCPFSQSKKCCMQNIMPTPPRLSVDVRHKQKCVSHDFLLRCSAQPLHGTLYVKITQRKICPTSTKRSFNSVYKHMGRLQQRQPSTVTRSHQPLYRKWHWYSRYKQKKQKKVRFAEDQME